MTSKGFRIVAERMVKEASVDGESEFDSFARSAFNRFYYSMFLDARKTLIELGFPGNLSHKRIPIHYRDTVTKKIKHAVRQDSKEHAIKSKAMLFCRTIAKSLEEAYAVRKIADYMPEELVVIKSNGEFVLGEMELEKVKQLGRLVEANTRRLEELWMGLNN